MVDVDDRKRAEEALREADRRKDEFLAMLATAPQSTRADPSLPCRAARSGDEVTVSREMRETMEQQVKHLVRLVDDLLDVSRLTTGRNTLRRSARRCLMCVGDAIETCREMIDAKGHRVTTDLPADALMVDGDRIRLVQVVTNVLNNAAKFTAAGGDVEIAAGCHDGAIDIRVRDTGVGISEDRLPHIFDLFFQSDQSPDRAHGGLGVGLTLARRLVDLHGVR